MTVVGFHASHEQIPPSRLLRDVVRAEEVGFSAAMCSDHITPWSTTQGQSGFAWSWLGAALASTRLTFGVVHAPGQRYHPAISAQMVATLAEMFPQRFWAALGTGQLMNEHVTGTDWPHKEERDARLAETVDVVRRLLAGEEVTHRGRVVVDRARVWSRPPAEAAPALLAAAITPRTAAWAGTWADGLITVNSSDDVLREVLGAYRDAGGRGPACLQVHVAWAPTRDEALAVAHDQWRTNVFASHVLSELAVPEQFDDVGRQVQPPGVDGPVVVEHDLGRLAERLAEMAGLGFDRLYLHHVGQDQEAWLDAAGQHVLPQLDVTAPEPLVGTTGAGTTAEALAARAPQGASA
ncbi:TIGR03885 family FMN-dependent LLM class oxidoreductase [Pseudokineococcus marinus]|uniref:TIGR03885 family FMN-dependent LLM class oxidoreductase n=1 Tax=Pseudokineococcus marinus TaxID=351215 RepID=A0A849BZM8_9ACTN|nr:TIGR03885 family FMN-dependent LLM class oxidoreductase [Pseudokineococcus marinus]NNH22928.1 TIGR03885 family FMN-dependent LLM class oxidoreductase [Pseudokineococcus marinus]